MTTSAQARTACLHDDAALSSMTFCCSTATEQDKTVAALRAERPVSWHRPVEKLLVENPNDQGFWPLVRRADLEEGPSVMSTLSLVRASLWSGLLWS